MNIINISKQKIFDTKHNVYAYELKFKNDENQEIDLSTNIKETAQLIINSISNDELNSLLGRETQAFINVNEHIFSRELLDVLDKERFILNISDSINLTENIVKKIIQYRKRGFRLCVTNFDSSAKMIIKFHILFNYIDLIKMDIMTSEQNNLKKIIKRFKGSRIKLIAQNIETKDEFKKCLQMGFDYFQGYYLDKPETIEIVGSKEPSQVVILQLIKLIKDNKETEELEYFIRRQPDLSFKLIQFFNNLKKFDTRVESLTQVITLMGRNRLLRWLLVYLYSEVSTNPASRTILDLAIKRAQRMEKEADTRYKEKAYLAGMFSMLDSIFDTDIKKLMSHIKMDRDITLLVLEKKGIFAGSLLRAEQAEREYLKKVMLANFDKLNTTDIIYTLEDGGVEINKEKL